ncbi:MAG: alpha/beta hydrolase fold domain-containing protein [Aeromicrobium sp.]
MTGVQAEAARSTLVADTISVEYEGRGRSAARLAARDVSLTVRRGEVLGLVGESGSGKSTTAAAIVGLVPYRGAVELDGERVVRRTLDQRRAFARRVQIVFQDPYPSMNPARTIGDAVAEPLRSAVGLKGAALDARVAAALEEVGLDRSAADRFPGQFSGGQRQRIAIARATAVDPDYIVCDEAVSALDLSVQAQVLNLLLRLQQDRDLGVLFISHDLGVVAHLSDRVAVMRSGQIVEEGPVDRVWTQPQHDYTRALLSSAPATRDAAPDGGSAHHDAPPAGLDLSALEPEVREHVLAEPVLPATLTTDETRTELRVHIDRNFERFGLPGPAMQSVDDHDVAIAGGVVRMRSYRSAGTGPDAPAHLLLHGGGWSSGSIDELVADATARHRAATGCVVFALDYRLAPEHRFPHAVDDVVAGLRHIRDRCAELGIDRRRISVGGVSAGANLAAAAVLAAPDVPLCGLVLEVPALDLTGESARRAAAEIGLPVEAAHQLQSAIDTYLDDPSDASTPLVSPLLAPDLSGFPPTEVVTAELDPLRLEGERFAARLADAGVAVRHTRFAGALHGSMLLTKTWPTARRWHDQVLAAISDLHSGIHPEGGHSD